MNMTKRSFVVCLVTLAAAVSVGQGGVDLGHGIELDALVWSKAHFYRYGSAGLSRNELVIERPSAIVGITGTVSRVATVRASADVSVPQALDLCLDLHWLSGFGLRVGQILLPLGLDAMTEAGHEKLATNSLLVGYAKPAWTRDIGVLGTWERRVLSISAAVVNGAGANTEDNNERKDLCGRVTVRPLRDVDLVVALRGYYGWPDAGQSAWRTLGVEAGLERAPFSIRSELQFQQHLDTRSDAGYIQLSYAAGLFEPCLRLDALVLNRQKPDLMLIGGVNAQLIGDNVKVMLNCFYRRNYQSSWDVSGFLLRLQSGL